MPLYIPSNLPAASIQPFAGNAAPEGWLFMAGQAISRITYAALFLAIGTTYGSGDGSTTFNLPDARGRALFGRDDMNGTAANRATTGGSGLNGGALGAVGGGESATLTAAQMPSHSHSDYYKSANELRFAGNYAAQSFGSTVLGGISNSWASTTSGAAGSSTAHSNMPPALIINYIIKT